MSEEDKLPFVIVIGCVVVLVVGAISGAAIEIAKAVHAPCVCADGGTP